MGTDCCNYKTNKDDLEKEIKKDIKITDFETKITKYDESEKSFIFKNSFRSANEFIFFEIKESPYEDYSKSLFSRLNDIRIHPLFFYSTSKKNKLNELLEKVINKQVKCNKLNWSSLKIKKIYKIMHNESINIKEKISQIENYFNKERKVFIYYAIGELDIYDDCLWNLLYNFPNESEKILTENYSSCVIYTENLTKEHYDNLANLKDYNNIKHNNSPLISFFFFFQ